MTGPHASPGRGSRGLKVLDRYLGVWLVLALGCMRRKRPLPKTIRRIALVKTAAIGDSILLVPVINRIAPAFVNVVLTQDWHPAGHASFASSYPGRKPFETIRLAYGEQVLWPDHCVQGTTDAALGKAVNVPQAELIVRKGYHRDIDSYSAFEEADRKTRTGLEGYLKERAIRQVFVTGLATDFCVAWTALDARKAGFQSYVIEDACRGIDLNGSLAAAWKHMAQRGVQRIQSTDLELG